MCSTGGRHSSQGQERVAQSLWAMGWAQADLTAWTQLIPRLKGKWRLRATPVCASAAPQITSQPQSSYFPGSGRPGPFLSQPSVNKERISQQIFVKSQSRLGRKELCQACSPQQTLGGGGLGCARGCWRQAPDHGVRARAGHLHASSPVPPALLGSVQATSKSHVLMSPLAVSLSGELSLTLAVAGSTLSVRVASINHGARRDKILVP